MDGGLIFFAHPKPCRGVSSGSIISGSAETTAVVDISAAPVEVTAVAAKDAPVGSRGGCFVLAALRRTGAKASAADHPSYDF